MFRRYGYSLVRAVVRLVARPRLAREPVEPLPDEPIYVLAQQSLSDLAVLDLVCAKRGWARPTSGVRLGALAESRRCLVLNRPTGIWGRHTMRTVPRRLTRLLDEPAASTSDMTLLPVNVFWGRTTSRERSLARLLFAEHWAATSRLRRFANLLVSRKHIVVDFGEPLPLREAAQGGSARRGRRAARLLRVRLRQQKVAVLGPDFSHRRTLARQVLDSRAVRDAIAQAVQADAPRDTGEAEKLRRTQHRLARRAAVQMAANLSYPTVFFTFRVLTWFWRHIYNGIETTGLAPIALLSRTHTLVYLPSHRSHIDYLLLSYLLFEKGLMLPHIAAGENMNMPLLGNLLKQGGAFYMPRSFQGKPMRAAVFSEYLYQMYRRGHSVEFFVEGGRSRTGRMLPPRTGLLKMSIDHARRGLPRPLALVPVYFGYERLIEAVAYVRELRGAQKKRESVIDLLRSLKLVRQNFGRVEINFGTPLVLDEWLAQAQDTADSAAATRLGREIIARINDVASINPVNLVALVMLCTPRLAIAEPILSEQIDCYQNLLRRDHEHHRYQVTSMSGAQAIKHVMELDMLTLEKHPFGNVLALPPASAVLMTWYRNNVAHALALPSLIACLLEKRQRPLARDSLERMVETVFPYLARELHARFDIADTLRWARHLLDAGLLRPAGDRLALPPRHAPEHHRLHLLAGIARPFLERNYIVLALLARTDRPSRLGLLEHSQRIARRVARLQGIDAPEFFDRRLFNGFLDKLIEDGTVVEDADGSLTRTPIVDDVLRTAERIVDAELHYALLEQ